MAYQKILVAIDDSEISANVIQQAAQLAKALNSQITLVQVMTLDPYLADAYLRMGQSNELIERVRSYVQENLTKAQKQFEELGQNIENLFERSLQLETQRQQANIEQLKAKSRPQPIMTLGVNRTRSADQNTENQIRLGVEIPLNIFNPQKYGIQIAEAKQTLIQQQQRFYRQQNQMDIDVRLAELRGLHMQFKQLNDQQVPLATQVQQKTLEGFRLGKFAVTDVQQATTQLQDVRLRKVQLLKQAWQLSVEVQSARMGLPVEQITAKDALMQLNQRVWQQSNSFPNQLGE